MRLTTLLLGCSLSLCTMAGGIRIEADTPHEHLDCGSPGELDVSGSLLEAGRDSFALDLCRPTQDCSSVIRAVFSAAAPGFSGFQRYLSRPSFIHVTIVVKNEGGVCSQSMTVAGIASWFGARNPAGRGNEPYFVVAANRAVAAGAWFQSVLCAGGPGSLGLRVENASVTLRLDAARELAGDDNARWTARLVSAGDCASSRNWSFWMVRKPPGH